MRTLIAALLIWLCAIAAGYLAGLNYTDLYIGITQ